MPVTTTSLRTLLFCMAANKRRVVSEKNVVAPGFIVTDMTDALGDAQKAALLGQVPLGRLGSPEDIAQAVAFLASPEAGYITGETLHVNGGMYMI